MLRKTQASRDRQLHMAIWGFFLFASALVYFCFHPFAWKNESHYTPGVPIVLESVSDFLIVVDYGAFNKNPDRFEDMEFSLAWLNTMQQEIGPVALMDASGFLDVDLSKYRCLILTRSVSNQDAWVPKIRGYLERGGTVVMEMPQNQLRTIASADGKGGLRAAQNITFISGLEDQWVQALSAVNLTNITQVVGSAGPLDDSQTYLTIDGVPVIYSKKYAMGHVITIDFNYGMLMTSLQQGRPWDDFSVRNRIDTPEIETSDLGLTETMSVPVADILERYLVQGVIGDSMPVVGFWPFFDGLDGALIVTQNENGFGDSSIWMAQYESTFKASSTLFALSPLGLSDDAVEVLQKSRCELGLMYDLSVGEQSLSREPMGPFRFSPVWHEFNIEEQVGEIKSALDEKFPMISSKSRLGLWSPHYTHTFRLLAAANFRADASYRSSFEAPGYAFATGLPFMPLDSNGLAFNIQEFPVSFPKISDSQTVELLSDLLKSSQSQIHETITVALDTDFYAKDPDIEKFLLWQSIYQTASSHKHWITSIVNFFRFTRARFSAEIRSKTVDFQVSRKNTKLLRIETLAPENGMTLSIPKMLDSRSFVEARRGLQRVREDMVTGDAIQPLSVSVIGFERLLVPLSKGFNAIDIVYE